MVKFPQRQDSQITRHKIVKPCKTTYLQPHLPVFSQNFTTFTGCSIHWGPFWALFGDSRSASGDLWPWRILWRSGASGSAPWHRCWLLAAGCSWAPWAPWAASSVRFHRISWGFSRSFWWGFNRVFLASRKNDMGFTLW